MAKSKKAKITKENKDIKGIILIAVGVLMLFSLISIFFQDSSPGIIGKFIRNVLFTFLGVGAYILPFVLFFIGKCFIVKKGKIEFNTRFYSIVTTIINTLVLIQMVKLNKFASENILDTFSNFYNSNTIIHGGFLSYILIAPVKFLIGNVGVYVICICVYIINAIILFDLSIGDVFINFKGNVKSKKKNIKNKLQKPEKIKIVDDTEQPIESDNELEKDVNRLKLMNFLKSTDGEKTANEPLVKQSISVDILDSNDDIVNSTNKKIVSKDTGEQSFENEIEKNISMAKENEFNIQYRIPPIDLLKENDALKNKRGDKKELLNNATKLQNTLSSFGVSASVTQVTKGPSVTRFEIQPETGVKVSKIVNLSDDIALNLAAPGIRMEAPIPGKAAIGIEVPNENLTPVFLREIIESEEYIKSTKNISFALGKDIGGNSVVADLSKMPHLLVAGATGSGKSVCINTLIVSLLYKYSPKEVNLLLIDPKVVELSIYNGIPHLLIPVVTDPKKAAGALNWAVTEMTRRYNLFAENGVRNIEGYNKLKEGQEDEKLSYQVIIIDELADLMMVCPKDVEDYIARLAQMARAAGMHLVIATQRPSVDVITGMIKANIPSRISFAVSSQIDSRTILDSSGAEKLLGKGDMLFYPVGAPKPVRIQGAFISEKEVENIVEFIKSQSEEVKYDEDIIEQIHANAEGGTAVNNDEEVDPILKEAINFVVESGYASTSMLQRKFKIGYNRAARIIDSMEERNIISGRNGSKPRDVLITLADLEHI
ncbi:FtsK/SpoIIIE family DNA translocase [Hathewaya limosa]|uniref:S-DNA-T family DNA segregation ATPase FtsK/SpoIIIE n=1 Tax=Hathewaya limosa TaxID=1536 RepID=A0ABU0JVH8_HATLI|nr:DNA translocase FtsK [Hathewaya limosa]MDQ0480143.1 S-DNA-T family DNA segregation ATPase FtsK/SpoIIIE [Hathewaya limosa]